jgi:formylglycine-generating enzyme required for sulfatase activity
MQTTPWSGQTYAKEGAEIPAIYVSWEDAAEFCQKLTILERQTGQLPEGWEYTLPTEAQWEYACRAGTSTAYSFGNDESDLIDFGWYGLRESDGNAKEEPYAHPVGQKKPNAFGLYDMHGNVWEWCRDWFQAELPGGTDPEVTSQQSPAHRVDRGGSWFYPAEYSRSAARGGFAPRARSLDLGFRVAAVSSVQPKR